ncbi:MAG: class I SAM-dependent methyltransferase [Bdellovibrionales bacterium]|jgi:hypothetical protein|nr:class I SAM-dependent methyltransferase [Bdellovibrionales bacterium]
MLENLSTERKYQLYEGSVQNHEGDIDFINEQYERINGEKPLSLREDFGGTGQLSCGWVKQSLEHQAWAVDLDPEPISYGKERHLSELEETRRNQVHYVLGNVLESQDFKADVTVAFNFSYFIFKKREELLNYFKKVKEGLNENGIFVIDLFGGTDSNQELVEETEYDDYSYFWDCENFNPITNECLYYIHFKDNGTKHERVFTYDWRMWSLPELREIMLEAGFSKSVAFWEGDDDDGGGDGDFYSTETAENCESWVTYIIGVR